MSTDRTAIIYWLTRDVSAKRRIMKRFGICGESVNGESTVTLTNNPDELRLFAECEQRGFFKRRNK